VKLIRDPYADYAQKVLRLEPLRSVSEDVDARERGTAVREAIELFEEEANEMSISALIEQELNKAGAAEELIRLEMPMWERAGAAYLRWSAERKPRPRRRGDGGKDVDHVRVVGGHSHAESNRRPRRAHERRHTRDHRFQDRPAQEGRASRDRSGAAARAGSCHRRTRALWSPAGRARVRAHLFQISMSAATLKETNGKPLQFDSGSTREIAEKALEGLKGLIELYANLAQPYYSKPRVEFIWNIADYDRLARRAEWSADEGGDE